MVPKTIKKRPLDNRKQLTMTQFVQNCSEDQPVRPSRPLHASGLSDSFHFNDNLDHLLSNVMDDAEKSRRVGLGNAVERTETDQDSMNAVSSSSHQEATTSVNSTQEWDRECRQVIEKSEAENARRISIVSNAGGVEPGNAALSDGLSLSRREGTNSVPCLKLRTTCGFGSTRNPWKPLRAQRKN